MKPRKAVIISVLALAAVAVVALALWRFIPRSLQGDSGHRPGGGHRHPLYGLF